MDSDPEPGESGRVPPRYDRPALVQYLALQDQIRWQGPALALAAQAFLLTVALAADAASTARIIGSVLGGATSGSAIYLISRKGRQIDAVKALLHDETFPIDGISSSGLSASRVWQFALAMFIAADILIVFLTIAYSSVLGPTT